MGTDDRVSSYDPAELVRSARIADNYRFANAGRLEEDEAMRCITCGVRSLLAGTPVFAWRRSDVDMEPPVVELCEICNAAAGGPPAAAE
jgi:hypothetical protein